MRFTLRCRLNFEKAVLELGLARIPFSFCNRRILSSDSRLQYLEKLDKSQIRDRAGSNSRLPTAPFPLEVKNSYNVYGISVDRPPTN
jgi:hypothetical protein